MKTSILVAMLGSLLPWARSAAQALPSAAAPTDSAAFQPADGAPLSLEWTKLVRGGRLDISGGRAGARALLFVQLAPSSIEPFPLDLLRSHDAVLPLGVLSASGSLSLPFQRVSAELAELDILLQLWAAAPAAGAQGLQASQVLRIRIGRELRKRDPVHIESSAVPVPRPVGTAGLEADRLLSARAIRALALASSG